MKKRQFRIVMTFEFMNYLRNKVYLGITLAIVLLLALGLSAPALIETAKELGVGGRPDPDLDDPTQTVYVIDYTQDEGLMPHLQAALPRERWRQGEAEAQDDYRLAVDKGEAKAILVIQSRTEITYIERRAGQNNLAFVIQPILTEYVQTRDLLAAGLEPEAINAALAPLQLNRVELVEEAGKSMEQTYFYTYLLLFLLYMTVMMYGQLVASSVASEKSNRAMEMLITSARPLSLMFGKVIGSGLAGLFQIGIFLLTAAGFYTLNQASWADIPFIRSVFAMPAHIIVYTVFFYLAGYFMYAFLYGALGSLASRIEDINTSIMPMMLVVMSAMLVSVFGMLSPEAGWLTVFSFIPFFSPMAMFVRIAMTDVPPLQIVLSIAIMLLTIFGTGWLASRIYRIGVLMYGKPPRLGELVRILRQEKA